MLPLKGAAYQLIGDDCLFASLSNSISIRAFDVFFLRKVLKLSSMKPTSIDDLVFELKDIEIFKIPDKKTRIATVQNYFFPRLEILLRYTVELIREVYEVNPYESMSFVYYPHNRPTAKENHNFHGVHIGLSGKRKTDRELKYKRRDGKPFRFHPTYLTYNIGFDGSMWVRFLPFRQYVSSEFIADAASLFEQDFAALSPILGRYQIAHIRGEQFVDMKDAFVGAKEEVSRTFFYSPVYYFPVNLDRGLWTSILCFVALYPLLDAFICLGEGLPVQLPEMLKKLVDWHFDEDWQNIDESDENETEETTEPSDLPELDSYTFVRAGLWWSVLAKDNWTCCSCGRSSKEEGITLEVDHIIPRSKGGSDDIDNLQTLCKKCNIGKSNRDATDLRRKA